MSRAYVAAFAASILVALAILVAQPIGSPWWWTYADADGSYTGSSLNILLGSGTRYLDHPACRSRNWGQSRSAQSTSRNA